MYRLELNKLTSELYISQYKTDVGGEAEEAGQLYTVAEKHFVLKVSHALRLVVEAHTVFQLAFII